jgi:hypothetical protein
MRRVCASIFRAVRACLSAGFSSPSFAVIRVPIFNVWSRVYGVFRARVGRILAEPRTGVFHIDSQSPFYRLPQNSSLSTLQSWARIPYFCWSKRGNAVVTIEL